jgi:hypothetical protein
MSQQTSLTISRGEFPAERLKRLEPEEQRLIVMAGHISNEITILQKILVACMNYRGKSEPARNGFATQNLVVAKVLGGKLVEAWQAMGRLYFGSRLSRDFGGRIMEESQAAEVELRRYFGRDNPLHKVRNSAAFHYSGDGVPEALAALQDDFPLQMYLAEETGNSLYFFAEQPMFMEVFGTPTDRSMHANFDEFVGDAQRIARHMTTFLQGCIDILWEKMAGDTELREETVPAEDIGGLHNAQMPFFLTENKEPKPAG